MKTDYIYEKVRIFSTKSKNATGHRSTLVHRHNITKSQHRNACQTVRNSDFVTTANEEMDGYSFVNGSTMGVTNGDQVFELHERNAAELIHSCRIENGKILDKLRWCQIGSTKMLTNTSHSRYKNVEVGRKSLARKKPKVMSPKKLVPGKSYVIKAPWYTGNYDPNSAVTKDNAYYIGSFLQGNKSRHVFVSHFVKDYTTKKVYKLSITASSLALEEAKDQKKCDTKHIKQFLNNARSLYTYTSIQNLPSVKSLTSTVAFETGGWKVVEEAQ